VTDPVSAAISATAARSLWAPALAFVAGVVTSIGPCVAPRFVAVAALTTAGGTGRWRIVAALVAGLCVSYVAVGMAGGILARVSAISTYVYACASAACLAFGVRELLRSPSAPCARHCAAPSSSAPAFLLGASFALVTSPCCTPAIVVLGTLAATQASVAFGALTIAAYALGHALPLAAAGFGWQRGAAWLPNQGSLQTVGGALMIALAGYYGVLA
jgi:cytochrome c biogenesis protein CcdA